ncbi:hypothetical protein F0562_006461 [Nyssa sinensis]|uniref:UDP-glycosyltransferases domain-containing protein n=1 Tax=Nyssa sinensis TaxID=561372 RepID=A0A5J5APY5_9ASTE|nr:hypothetical protein F0562_006461 [Nyssa sinensis]
MDSSKLHAAILCGPGMGHLIPILVLGERLVTHHNFEVTILVVTTPSSADQSQLLHPTASPKQFNIIEIPSVDVSCLLDPDAKVITQLAVMMREARPGIRSAISNMEIRPTVFIVDIFATESFEIADEFDMSKYVFVPTTAWFTALMAYCHVLDKEVEGQYGDQKEPLRLPGCKAVRPEDLVDPMLDRNDQMYQALRENEILRSVIKVPVYPIGPLRRSYEVARSRVEQLEWLDMQPSESVIYVSFGSGGTLSAEQITELAWGLEVSQQKFVWVVRPPIKGSVDGFLFTVGNGPDGTPDYLPDGFLTRTHNVGIVVPMWAPQVKILSHPSVGGFLSHCGWNSTLESLTNGVPMVAWPLYAE